MDSPSPSDMLERVLAAVREQFDPEFEFLTPGELPWSKPPASLDTACVALITTAGLHLRGDPPFRTAEEPLGDTSFRVVPHGTWPRELALDAVYVDRRFVAQDPEVALPMRALERLHRERRVGRPAARHWSFCAGIVRPYPGLEQSVEGLVPLLREDGVDVVVLLPTCSLCVQTVCLLARELESRGFATVTLTMIPELSSIVGAPRTLSVRFPFGAPCGDPERRDLHRAVLFEALELLGESAVAGEMRATRYSWKRDPG